MGGLIAVIGGAAMVLSVFLPWQRYLSLGSSATGWDTHTLTSGSARWFTTSAFNADALSPGFSGAVVLIAAGLLVLPGLRMLLSLAGGAVRLRVAEAVALAVAALVAFGVAATNLVSIYATGNPNLVTPEFGLFVLGAGAAIGLTGVWVGLSRRRS